MQSLPPDLAATLETHLGAPLARDATPLSVLATHLSVLPPGLARAVGAYTTPRERTRIPEIKTRRVLFAMGHYSTVNPATISHTGSTSASASASAASAAAGVGAGSNPASVLPAAPTQPTPRPPLPLTAAAGRVRWPLLWERLGGDPRPPSLTAGQAEEASWAREGFMPGHEAFVGRLGRLLAEDEEIREWEIARDSRRRERRMDEEGEEFDSESDEEGDTDVVFQRVVNGHQATGPGATAAASSNVPLLPPPPGTQLPPGIVAAAAGEREQGQENDQESVEIEFERRLRELFIDGLDTIDYDPIDYTEPPADPIGARDREEAYFDTEAPSTSGTRTPNGTRDLEGSANLAPNGTSSRAVQPNGHRSVYERYARADGESVQNGHGEYDY